VTAGFPVSIEAIDAAWLQSTLGVPDLTLGAVTPIGHGTSSEVMRLTFTRNGEAGSLIAKAPRREPDNGRPNAAVLGYAREVEAYRFFGPGTPFRIPACPFAAHDGDGGFLLLLEDMSEGWRAGDQTAGCGIAEAKAVVAELAALHARYWKADALERLDWPRRRTTGAAQSAALYARGAAAMRARYVELLDADDLALIDSVIPLAAPWNAREPAPATLIHADPRVDNILFADTPGGTRACLVDLQSIGFWDPAFDIAYFLSGSLDPDLRRRCERHLVATHAAVMAQADPGYDPELAWARYRQHAICGLLGTVVAAALVRFSPHVDRLLVALAQRNCATVRDLDGIAAARDWIAGR
jgi:hypothetical protein